MEVTRSIAKRATCDRDRSGCVIAKNNRLLVTWYVGSPSWMPHCDQVWHHFKQVTHENGNVTNHCMRTVHAEQNAICQAARLGVSVEWWTLYCKVTPCRTCAMLIVSSGIKKVVCEEKNEASSESEEIFKEIGVELNYIN